jgi:hypothetical protein
MTSHNGLIASLSRNVSEHKVALHKNTLCVVILSFKYLYFILSVATLSNGFLYSYAGCRGAMNYPVKKFYMIGPWTSRLLGRESNLGSR